ncbi:hypothetical protein [Gordonia alkaliphila]|uniref:MFS transporter n=1 Tax=Gordonia alkaliphila TaxID=1053547 RepID=A0ABP8Z3T1_9ACTN
MMGVWAIPMWFLMASSSADNMWPLVVAIFVSCLAMSFQTGPQPALFAEIVPAKVRYSGASLGYQFAAVIGGTAPMVMVAVINGQVDQIWRIGPIISVLAVVGLVSLYTLKLRQERATAEAA